MRKTGLFGLALLLMLSATAEAQLGVVNPFVLPPGTNPLAVTPFGKSPHPLNNVLWPRIMATYQVPPVTAVIPMETAQPGSLPPAIEVKAVTLPGYAVTEMVGGYLVHEHWGVRQVGNAYYWTYFPANFVWK